MTPIDAALISITYSHPARQSEACALAESLQLPCVSLSKCKSELALNFNEMQVELLDLAQKMQLSVDFIHGALGHRKKYGGGRGQTIAKAVGLKQGKPLPHVLDATAGLGKDSYVLACLGCKIDMLERSPVVTALLADGIARAGLNIDFEEIMQQGFNLHNRDALSYLESIDEDNKPDVIYLDPMYPEKKKSASVKKNMQMLQKLLGHDLDADQLLDAALDKAQQRVVVKRPKGAPQLKASRQPTLAYESKSTRYDTYII
jgi:16S rRNA (guanine1516-N2)-methyltransferase